MKFGKLTLIERLTGGQKWLCQCDCGNLVTTQISGGSRSCNDCAYETRGNLKHGYDRKGKPTRLYRIWVGMKSRCHNSNDSGFKYYGSRGIRVCDEWRKNFESFRDWALSHGYDDNLTIERKDVDGNYCPENCEWITQDKQSKNRRFSTYQYGRDEKGRFLKKGVHHYDDKTN